MRELSVWAPGRKCVALDVAGRRAPMERCGSGWWSVQIPDGTLDYGFVLDGGPPLPDPRSRWQPFGVHGPSRTVDHCAFRWSDHGWNAPPLDAAIVYELHVGTFTEAGTFEAAISRIPHLTALGVTHVELMPVAEFAGSRGWGYDGAALYAPHHAYGGPEGLKRLVDALHANGLAAILDVVYNHLGPSGNYLGSYGPYFTSHIRTPWGDAMNLGGAGSDPVRSFFIENALMWLRDYHLDGLRLDAVHALADPSALHFLEELTAAVNQLQARLGRSLAVIAESDLNDPRLIRPREVGGYGLGAQWSDDFHHALHTVLTGERTGYYRDFGSFRHLAKAIESGYVYDGQYSSFRDRRHGRPLDPALKSKLLGYLQNHDQVGNRARGDRIARLTTAGRAKIGAALVLLGPFVPLLFQGEEWGASTPFQYFTDHGEPELARAVSDGRRREFETFGWDPDEIPDPQDEDTFLRSKLNWRELDRDPHAEFLSWYRQLIRLRKEHAQLRSPDAAATFSEEDGLFAMHRPGMSVVCNLNPARTAAWRTPPAATLLGCSDLPSQRDGELELAPESVVIVRDRGRAEEVGG